MSFTRNGPPRASHLRLLGAVPRTLVLRSLLRRACVHFQLEVLFLTPRRISPSVEDGNTRRPGRVKRINPRLLLLLRRAGPGLLLSSRIDANSEGELCHTDE